MNRTRWSFLVLLVICAALLAAVGLRGATAAALDADTMRVALHTATTEEDGFIDKVLLAVRQGELPGSLVQSTFLWARRKPHHQFQYFKRGLILRASQQGILLQSR
ncbi:MAG: hypothetical protein ABFC77_04925 [Thermoguttaceae bacterium]